MSLTLSHTVIYVLSIFLPFWRRVSEWLWQSGQLPSSPYVHVSVFQWSTGYWISAAIVAGLLRRQMLNFSAS